MTAIFDAENPFATEFSAEDTRIFVFLRIMSAKKLKFGKKFRQKPLF